MAAAKIAKHLTGSRPQRSVRATPQRPERAQPRAQRKAQPRRHEVKLAAGRPDPPQAPLRILDQPLARWIAVVAAGVALVTLLLLAAGVWAKQRVVKL